MNTLLSVALAIITASNSIQAAFHNRIVGGSRADIRLSPYQVLLYVGDHLCGGSLINSNCVLTAAHCTTELDPREILVRGGVTNRLEEGGMASKGIEIFIPKDYDPDSKHMDVSIIRLSRPIEGDDIRPIQLSSSDADIGTTCKVTGWGKTSENERKMSDVLQQTFVKTISNEDCQDKYRKYKITEAMLCAYAPEGTTDSCSGDSGGPLVADGLQYGIVSWGVGCARPDKPGVYTNVAAVRPWIDETVEKFCQ